MRLRMRIAVIVLALVAIAAFAVLAILNPAVALKGWLAAFVWAGMIPIGSLTLLLVHRITGGEWGFALAPVLEPAARAIGGVALLAIPVVIFPAAIYRWQSPEMPRPVADYYMTGPLFALRTIAAFCAWTMLAWLPCLRRSVTGAAVGLIVLGVVTNVIAVDWVESTQPGYHSSSFGFGLWIEQMLAAFAFCALIGTEGDEKRECRDLAGLLIATLLGTIYFVYVEFAVIWYGNLPKKAAWFISRSHAPWPEIGGFAFAIGAVAPFLALLSKEARESEKWLRVIGGAMSVAIVLHVIWLVVPSFEDAAILPALIALPAIAMAFALWIGRFTGLWPPTWGPTIVPAERNA